MHHQQIGNGDKHDWMIHTGGYDVNPRNPRKAKPHCGFRRMGPETYSRWIARYWFGRMAVACVGVDADVWRIALRAS